MGPTRKRDLTAAVLGTAVVGYLLVVLLYRWFPPITVWTGLSLLVFGVAEAVWGRYVRAKISDGEIGDGPGWLHPLSVARSLVIAKASAWVGALALGWWVGVLVYLLPRRSWLRVAGEDTAGTAVAAVSALALVIAALWLHIAASRRGIRPSMARASRVSSARWRRSSCTGPSRRRAISPGENRRSTATRGATSARYSRAMTDLSRGARLYRPEVTTRVAVLRRFSPGLIARSGLTEPG